MFNNCYPIFPSPFFPYPETAKSRLSHPKRILSSFFFRFSHFCLRGELIASLKKARAPFLRPIHIYWKLLALCLCLYSNFKAKLLILIIASLHPLHASLQEAFSIRLSMGLWVCNASLRTNTKTGRKPREKN